MLLITKLNRSVVEIFKKIPKIICLKAATVVCSGIVKDFPTKAQLRSFQNSLKIMTKFSIAKDMLTLWGGGKSIILGKTAIGYWAITSTKEGAVNYAETC